MQQILVYADSLSWGIIPDTRQRLPFAQRWPGAMEIALNQHQPQVRVIEDCLNGRRTVFEDPYKPGRNGLQGLAQRIEIHSPLALVILMLGSNDFQSMHPHQAWHASQGVAALIHAIRTAPIEPGMPLPPILVVAPPAMTEPRGAIAPKFVGAADKCARLAELYQAVCQQSDCHFFDAGSVTTTSRVDGVHLDADQHATLALALADRVRPLLR
ncbi:MAG TPA: SGNH/GDSL hydrolase family protein [Methylophilus sp.]